MRFVPLVLIVLLVPFAHAAYLGAPTATEARVDGATLNAGPLTVLAVGAPVEEAGYELVSLEAARVDVLTESTTMDPAVFAIGVSQTDFNRSVYHDVHAVTTDMGSRPYLFAAPMAYRDAPTVEAAAPSARLSPSDGQTIVQDDHVPGGRPASEVPTQGTVRVHVSAGTLTIQGDVFLFLHGPAIGIDHASGSDELRTGQHVERYTDPVLGFRTVERVRFTQAFLFAQDATVQIRVIDAQQLSMFLDATATAVHGEVRLKGARGVVDVAGGPRSADGDDIAWSGSLHMTVAVASDRLQTRVTGDPDTVTVAGTVFVIDPGTPLWWLLLAIPLVAAAYHASARWRLSRISRAMDAAAYEAVVDARLPGILRTRRQARIMHVVACTRLGRLAAAEQALTGLPRRGKTGAMRHFIEAHLHALQGREQDARACIRRTLKILPDMEAEVMANPRLARLWKDVEGYS